MKYWVENKNRDKQECVYLKDDDRIISISVNDNKVTFTKACDEWFSTTLSKQEAIEALKELIEYINKYEQTI